MPDDGFEDLDKVLAEISPVSPSPNRHVYFDQQNFSCKIQVATFGPRTCPNLVTLKNTPKCNFSKLYRLTTNLHQLKIKEHFKSKYF